MVTLWLVAGVSLLTVLPSAGVVPHSTQPVTSSSTVQNLYDLLGDDAAERLNALRLFSIGPVTTKTAQGLGLRMTATSKEQTIESLVDAVRAYYSERDGNG